MILVILTGLTGCEKKRDSDKTAITMYLWDKPMMKELTSWLEERFPDIDFTFVAGYNSMDYYIDLSETNVAGSYYDSYIENNREPGGGPYDGFHCVQR